MPSEVGSPTPATEPFVHLHTHTEYSLLDGAARIKELVATAQAMGQPGVAITDHGVLYGAVEFYAAARAAGINPIIGCEMYMAPRSRHDKEGRADRDPSHLVLLARNEVGYRNLVAMVSKSHLEGYYYKPRIDKQLLADHAEGIIGLSACIGGELPQAILSGDMNAAESVARRHMEILGHDNYGLEIQDHGIPEEIAIREGLVEIARRTGLPLVCTNDSHYINADDAEAHDILLCLQTGARRQETQRFKFAGPHFYMASGAEMRERFAAYGEAASNTVAFAARCNVELALGQNHLPRYRPIPDGMDAHSYLIHLCELGLRERYGESPTREAHERLAMELDVIGTTGFSAYFLIVWDLIRAARCDGVKVGPGRGSSAGSLVAYVLQITNVCPLRYGILFERFLNKERLSMPDIDIDFDDKRRDRVLGYVQEKYGHDHVAQIITFGTMAARAAIRDVGRVLDVPLPEVDRLAKLVPATVGITLSRALEETRELRELYEAEPWARQIIDIAKRLEGICRNASTHAAGVVIAPEPLTNIVPLQRSTNDRDSVVTQFDMGSVQRVGLLKMDFLGLANLTVIDDAVTNVKRVQGVDIDLDNLPLDDGATYALLGKADTWGVFQMEQSGAKRILIDMQPTCLEDVAVAGALNRPGPIEGGVIEIYMRRKRGEEAIEYVLPELEPILAESYGTIIYQDQVMKIANQVAGYSLGEADILRAAMGKKDKAKMALQREKFIAGAVGRDVAEKTAADLFDLITFFAGYGFPKAHSVAYGLISYQTAYLKANYPLEYMAALLNMRAGDFDKLKLTILDSHARGLVVRPPDINRSAAEFSVGDAAQQEILYGLRHIKNVGEKVIETVLAARNHDGPFTSLLDLCMRAGGRDLNRRVLEALVRSGACDCLGERALLLALLDRAMDRATQIRRERDSGQTSLFGDVIEADMAAATATTVVTAATAGTAATATTAVTSSASPSEDLGSVAGVQPAAEDERLGWERELLGMYLSDHPLRRVAAVLQERIDTTVAELGPHLDGLIVQIGGAVRSVRAFVPRKSPTGARMAFLQIEDLTGTCEVVVFARTFEECAALLRPDAIVIVRGRVEGAARENPATVADDEDRADTVAPVKILAEAVYGLDDARLLAWRRNSTVHLTVKADHAGLLPPLHRAITGHRGDTPVVLHVDGARSIDEVELGDENSVQPGPGLERSIESLLGPGSYRIEVKRDKAPVREVRGAARRG